MLSTPRATYRVATMSGSSE